MTDEKKTLTDDDILTRTMGRRTFLGQVGVAVVFATAVIGTGGCGSTDPIADGTDADAVADVVDADVTDAPGDTTDVTDADAGDATDVD